MRILIVTNYLPPKIGGIERHTHELASELHVKLGHKVTVASAPWPAQYVSGNAFNVPFPYAVINFPSFSVARRLPIPNLLSPRFWISLKKLPKDFDLVLFQSHLFVLNWILAIRYGASSRKIWMNHGCNFIPIDNRIGNHISHAYERVGMFVMKRFCNEFLAQSKNAADWISLKIDREFGVLPNAINMDHFTDLRIDSNEVDRFSVLFVGRLVRGKGLLECIELVSEANRLLTSTGQSERFHLTIIGSGPLRGEAEVLISQLRLNARLLGELSHSAVMKEMCGSRFLIQAYERPEGMPTVALEAVACGMTIVSTPVGGSGELESCVNFLSGPIELLPQLLVEAVRRNIDRSVLVEKGRLFLSNGHTWASISAQLINPNSTL